MTIDSPDTTTTLTCRHCNHSIQVTIPIGKETLVRCAGCDIGYHVYPWIMHGADGSKTINYIMHNTLDRMLDALTNRMNAASTRMIAQRHVDRLDADEYETMLDAFCNLMETVADPSVTQHRVIARPVEQQIIAHTLVDNTHPVGRTFIPESAFATLMNTHIDHIPAFHANPLYDSIPELDSRELRNKDSP